MSVSLLHTTIRTRAPRGRPPTVTGNFTMSLNRPPSGHLHPSDRKLCTLAGSRALEDSAIQEALEALRSEGVAVRTRAIRMAGQGVQVATSAATEGFQTLVAIGGDGTLHEVVNGAMASDAAHTVSVATVPFGTANDFASANGIPTDDPVAALRIAADPAAASIDLIRINGQYLINAATGGAAAEVTAEASKTLKQILGKFAYLARGVAQATRAEATPIRASGPDFSWEGPALTFVVANSRWAGGGVHVAPRARLNDGLLDLLVVPDMPLAELAPIVLDLLADEPTLANPHLVYRQLPWVDVTASVELPINLDGQPTRGRDFHFEVVPGCLRFHFPRPAPTLNPADRLQATTP